MNLGADFGLHSSSVDASDTKITYLFKNVPRMIREYNSNILKAEYLA